MLRSMWLLLLLALGGTNAKEPKHITFESGNQGTAEIEPQPESESLSESGYLIIQPTSDLQNENAKAITTLREKLENSVRGILSDLPNTSKKRRRQALQEALDTLTGLSLALPKLETSLSAIGKQQKVIVRLFRHQEEWRFWAADQVRKVMESTEGLHTAEAVTVTEEVNKRYGSRLRSCAGEFIWLQIRFNLDLAKTLDSLQSPANQLIEASEGCSKLRAKKCRNAIRDALRGLMLAPQDLDERWSASCQLEKSQSTAVRCMEQALEEYTEERLLTETSLQGVIQDYRESIGDTMED
ncbi:uncharacterized protein [Drosophila kikkawai]|uniref:Uncharacterized protein n=1 Tax=Drosophila kikkawai TaxID=30033 RepID=A0A6P4IJG6_DROKI|nr:uncharacterized protein LOC108075709 [Drosophila kikkawai]